MLPSSVKGLKNECFYYSKNANKENVNQHKNQNIRSGYLPVEKSAIKTLEQGVETVQSSQKKTPERPH